MNGFKQFLEMPLSNYRVSNFAHPEIDNKDSGEAKNFFTRLDRKLITLDRTKNCLSVALKKHNYNFNFILLESREYITSDGYLDEIKKFMISNNVPMENHITFATNSSTGHPSTCWMLLHKFGHALFGDSLDNKFSTKIKDMISNSYGLEIKRFFKFKSATNPDFKSAVNSKSELICELVAEYLWHGKIRYEQPKNTNPNIISIEQFVHNVERIIEMALEDSVGKILIDYFYD